jgi:hypothetical protein
VAASREEMVLSAFLAVAADLGRKLPEAVNLAAMAQSPLVEALGSYARALGSPAASQGQAGGLPYLIAPLARLVIGLFGGGEEPAPAPLAKFALQARMRFDAADGPGASLLAADYGQDGLPRAYAPEKAGQTGQAGAQVTVNVQAMDSRSFLDHKEDIARAVREAMLNSHSLNDVVSEL